MWPQCQQAAGEYGKRWDKLTEPRVKAMAARLGEYPERGPEILVEAIHGYVLLRRPKEPDGFDWRRYLDPRTIYAASKFPQYLEAWDEKRADDAWIAGEAAEAVDLPPEELAGIVRLLKLEEGLGDIEVPDDARRAYEASLARARARAPC